MELMELSSSIHHHYPKIAKRLLQAPKVDVGEWHAMDVSGVDALVSREVQDIVISVPVKATKERWATSVAPNLPWAEDHFLERVSGEPLNPPPSNEWWPFATGSNAGNDRHKKNGVFSHTYPERFWPKRAGDRLKSMLPDHRGIRFPHGDLNDLVNMLKRNPLSRQAYLPVWFPEDLGAADQGERVPCTLGYHFMFRPIEDGCLALTCNYYLRSCDFMRYFRDDMYMAGRLMQWVCHEVQEGVDSPLYTGKLNIHISSLHAFNGDEVKLKELAGE